MVKTIFRVMCVIICMILIGCSTGSGGNGCASNNTPGLNGTSATLQDPTTQRNKTAQIQTTVIDESKAFHTDEQIIVYVNGSYMNLTDAMMMTYKYLGDSFVMTNQTCPTGYSRSGQNRNVITCTHDYTLSCRYNGANMYVYCDLGDTRVGCTDAGSGRNHGISLVSDSGRDGCYAWEGSDNYGGQNCDLTCTGTMSYTIPYIQSYTYPAQSYFVQDDSFYGHMGDDIFVMRNGKSITLDDAFHQVWDERMKNHNEYANDVSRPVQNMTTSPAITQNVRYRGHNSSVVYVQNFITANTTVTLQWIFDEYFGS